MLRAEIDAFEKAVRKIMIREFIKKLHPFRFVRLIGGTKTIGDILEEYKMELEK